MRVPVHEDFAHALATRQHHHVRVRGSVLDAEGGAEVRDGGAAEGTPLALRGLTPAALLETSLLPALVGRGGGEGESGGEGGGALEGEERLVDVDGLAGGRELVEGVTRLAETEEHAAGNVAPEVLEGVRAFGDAERLVGGVSDGRVDVRQRVGVLVVRQLRQEERGALGTHATVHGEGGCDGLRALEGSDGIGGGSFFLRLDGESQRLGIDRQFGGDGDIADGTNGLQNHGLGHVFQHGDNGGE